MIKFQWEERKNLKKEGFDPEVFEKMVPQGFLTNDYDDDDDCDCDCCDDDDYCDYYDDDDHFFGPYPEEELSPEEQFKREISEHAYCSILFVANSPETEYNYGLKPELYLKGGPFSGEFNSLEEKVIYNDLITEMSILGYKVKTVMALGERMLRVSWSQPDFNQV